MIALDTHKHENGAVLKVIGVGGGGGNAINNMVKKGLQGVEFIAANTDLQALEHNLAHIKIQLGKDTTRGLGAGADPEVGRDSVEESKEQIKEALKGSDMIFVTAGMGGGTGTGGASVISQVGQEIGALVVGIVTKPFNWEGKRRTKVAEQWTEELRKYVDALIVIPNQRLLDIIDKNTGFGEAFLKVDEVLYNATRGISDIISCHGVVNVDFADVKTVMKGMGDALMGIGVASGESRATEATQKALNSPLLDGVSIHGAKGLLVNITGGSNLTMHEISEAVSIVEEAAGGDANLIHGVVYNESMTEEVMVTVVATGFNKKDDRPVRHEQQASAPQADPAPASENIDNMNFRTRFPETLPMAASAPKPDMTRVADSYDFGPKGPNQLNKFDAPAYLRRGESGSNLGGLGQTRLNQLRETASEPVKKISKEVYEQPAFLRKIMD